MEKSEFPKNYPHRLTPYPNFRFKVKWDTDYIAGVSHVSGLTRETEVMRHRDGGDPSVVHLAPGQTQYGPITMERGVSYDKSFAQWANKVFDLANSQGKGNNTSLGDFRKTVTIDVFNEAGTHVLSYTVFNAWVSQVSGISDLDGSGDAFIMESITIQNEGWDRVWSVTETKEKTFTEPASS